MIYYAMCGLRVCSDLVLPANATEAGPIDVSIIAGDANWIEADLRGSDASAQIGSLELRLAYAGIGQFLMRRGTEIVYDARKDVDSDELVYTILTACLAVILHQRGLLILHGSALNIGDRAVVMLGAGGVGKSTLAAALHARGHGFITDDLVPIEFGEAGAIRCRPTVPHFRLKHDSSEKLAARLEIRLQGLGVKRLAITRNVPQNQFFPLGIIYILEDGPAIVFENLSGSRSAIELVRHSYLARLAHPLGEAVKHFTQCSAISESIPIRRLRFPRDFYALSQLCVCLETDFLLT